MTAPQRQDHRKKSVLAEEVRIRSIALRHVGCEVPGDPDGIQSREELLLVGDSG